MVVGYHIPSEYMGLIDLDLSVLFQLGVFLVFLVLINFVLFRPLMQTLDARRERTTGAREQAARDDAEAREKIAAYEGHLAEAGGEGAELRKALREEGQADARKRVEKARAEQERRLRDGARRAREAYELARGSVPVQARPLAESISAKLLGSIKKA